MGARCADLGLDMPERCAFSIVIRANYHEYMIQSCKCTLGKRAAKRSIAHMQFQKEGTRNKYSLQVGLGFVLHPSGVRSRKRYSFDEFLI